MTDNFTYRIAQNISNALQITFTATPNLSDQELSYIPPNTERIPSMFKGMTHTPETRARISEACKRENLKPSTLEKYRLAKLGEKNPCYGKRWINNGRRHRRVAQANLAYYLSEGWVEGRMIERDPNTGCFSKNEQSFEKRDRDEKGRFFKQDMKIISYNSERK